VQLIAALLGVVSIGSVWVLLNLLMPGSPDRSFGLSMLLAGAPYAWAVIAFYERRYGRGAWARMQQEAALKQVRVYRWMFGYVLGPLALIAAIVIVPTALVPQWRIGHSGERGMLTLTSLDCSADPCAWWGDLAGPGAPTPGVTSVKLQGDLPNGQVGDGWAVWYSFATNEAYLPGAETRWKTTGLAALGCALYALVDAVWFLRRLRRRRSARADAAPS
jgi:hypothetical protein